VLQGSDGYQGDKEQFRQDTLEAEVRGRLLVYSSNRRRIL
jgi:hypothetical protein